MNHTQDCRSAEVLLLQHTIPNPHTLFYFSILLLLTCAGGAPLPWRLTKEAVSDVDARIRSIIYPHNLHGCSNDNGSFINGVCSWRTAEKLLALLNILPTALRDYIPELRAGLRKLSWGLKILEGRCINAQEALKLGVEPGSRPITPTCIKKAEILIAEGLSMLEGCAFYLNHKQLAITHDKT